MKKRIAIIILGCAMLTGCGTTTAREAQATTQVIEEVQTAVVTGETEIAVQLENGLISPDKEKSNNSSSEKNSYRSFDSNTQKEDSEIDAEDNANIDIADILAAYQEAAENYDEEGYYAMMYLDDDDIPECVYRVPGYWLLVMSYQDGEVYLDGTGRDDRCDGYSYIEGTNQLCLNCYDGNVYFNGWKQDDAAFCGDHGLSIMCYQEKEETADGIIFTSYDGKGRKIPDRDFEDFVSDFNSNAQFIDPIYDTVEEAYEALVF